VRQFDDVVPENGQKHGDTIHHMRSFYLPLLSSTVLNSLQCVILRHAERSLRLDNLDHRCGKLSYRLNEGVVELAHPRFESTADLGRHGALRRRLIVR
jgi:hypothetical protein